MACFAGAREGAAVQPPLRTSPSLSTPSLLGQGSCARGAACRFSHGGVAPAPAARGSYPALPPGAPPPDVEGFIALHHLDDKIAPKLRALAPERQAAVMARDVSGVRNVSAVVW